MNQNVDIHACEGDVVGFDFNREVGIVSCCHTSIDIEYYNFA